MKIKDLQNQEEGLFADFKYSNEIYFQEHPNHSPYLSYGEDENGNATEPYIGVEDEQGNAICAGIDERLN